jgi:hypothetical protein
VTSLSSAALAIAQRGLAVFPCRARDKIPITRHGCLDASTDTAQVSAWWKQYPAANIGIATGSKSSVWVVDIDGMDGERSLGGILDEYKAKLPQTVESITGSGGRHIFFRLPDYDAPVIKNSARQLGAGLDIRGEGGYVIAPPSIHPNGRTYAWSVDSGSSFVEAPIWFLQHVTLPRHRDANGSEYRRLPGDHWAAIAKGVSEGCRNHTAASFAGYLLRHGIDAQATLELMLAWNRERNHPPLPDQQIVSTVESIAKRELLRLQGFK